MRVAIVVSAIVTLAIAAIGPRVLWRFVHESWRWRPPEPELPYEPFWFFNGLALAFVVVLAIVVARRYLASRLVFVAVALPLLHLMMMVAAWYVFETLETTWPRLRALVPLIDELSITTALRLFGAASIGAAFVIARRRQREVLRTLVTLTLAHLFVLGLALPIVARLCTDARAIYARTVEPSMVVGLLASTFAIACVATAFVIRAPHLLVRVRQGTVVLIGMVLFAGVALRVGASESAFEFYASFHHVIFVLAFLATAALAVFAIATWWAARTPARAWLAGTIVDDGERIVGCVHVPSWLCGPRTLLRGFELETSSGPVPVPSAVLHARMPLWTSVMRAGEAIVVLRAGDPARATGFVTAGGEHPFRGSNALVPGAGGILVMPESEDTPLGTHVALVLWRPSVAYLLILIALALPSLLAVLHAG